jgi:hypothetical protein
MGLEEDYPKTHSNHLAALRALLGKDAELDAREQEDVALSLNEMYDKAQDLADIMRRLLTEPHTPAEVGQLLLAFEMTAEQIRGHSGALDGKLDEIGQRLGALTPTARE